MALYYHFIGGHYTRDKFIREARQHGGSNRLTNLRTLCDDCHKIVHPWLEVNHAY